MPSLIRSAKGTLWKVGDGTSPESFDTIGQMKSFNLSGPTVSMVDTTPHSTSNWMEKLGVLIDPGEISGELNYDKADALHAFSAGIWQAIVNLDDRNVQVWGPASIVKLEMPGQFSGHSFNFPVDNVLSCGISFTVTGSIAATNP